MKFSKPHRHSGESPTNRRVFKVDDEIEVVVHDVNLKTSKSSRKSKLRESIKHVVGEDLEWLGSKSSFVLAGNPCCLTNRYTTESSPADTKTSIKKELDLLNEVVNSRSPSNNNLISKSRRTSKRNQKNENKYPETKSGTSIYPRRIRYNPIDIDDKADLKDCHLKDCISDMSEFNSDIKITSAPQVVVLYSEEEEDDDDNVIETPEVPQKPKIAISPLKTSPISECSKLSLSSAEIRHSPSLAFKESVSDSESLLNSSNIVSSSDADVEEAYSEGVVQNAAYDAHVTVKQEFDNPDQVENKKKNRRKQCELDLLYVSLKEIPWAQSWSPKTFLSRNIKSLFPKREIAKRNETEEVKNVAKKRPTLLVKSNKGRPRKLVGKTKVGRPSVKAKSDTLVTKDKQVPVIKRKKIKIEPEATDEPTEVPSRRKRSLWKNSSASSDDTENLSSNASHKLSTDLAIKQYDASKMCRVKSSSKKKSNAQLNLNNCSKKTQPTPVSLPTKLPETSTIKPLGVSSSTVGTLAVTVPTVTVVATPKLKELPTLKTAVVTSKPRLKVSPKILPYTGSTTDFNAFPATATSSEGPTAVTNDTVSVETDLLLQKQLFSVLGKDQTEQKKRKLDDESLRYSVRQSECAFRYKEIAVKKHSNYIQIILVPNRSRHNGLTLEALQELREALIAAKKDASCKVLLLNSSGSIFCSGLDLASLVGQIHMPQKMSQAVRSLIETLALFSKPVVAAVNGAAVGLGVTLLAYCDVVFASEKATFFTPYAHLGHIPEGAMTLVLPQVVGSLVASDMLLRGRKLTAFQASIYGLVSEVLWPSQFMESVIPRVQAMANQSGQAMESTKVLLRYHQWDKLQSTLENECRLLPKQWLSLPCQRAFKEALAQPGGLID